MNSDGIAKDQAPASARLAPILVQLYKKLAPLRAEAHGELRVVRGSYAFARLATAVHLTGGEFMPACHDFPILFVMAGDAPVPIALLGLRKDNNLFVDGRGQWRRGAYVPAYLRRYPFLFPETPDPKQLAVLIDEESPLISKQNGTLLFEDGKRGSALDQAMALGRDFHIDQSRTRPALRALRDHGLFEKRDLEVPVPGLRKIVLRDFWVIDQGRFATLPSDAFLDLRALGAIDLAYFHFASMSRLASLGGHLAERVRPPQRPPQPLPAAAAAKPPARLN